MKAGRFPLKLYLPACPDCGARPNIADFYTYQWAHDCPNAGSVVWWDAIPRPDQEARAERLNGSPQRPHTKPLIERILGNRPPLPPAS